MEPLSFYTVGEPFLKKPRKTLKFEGAKIIEERTE